MNLVDSSGWLEFFADGPNAGFFAPALQKPAELLVPTIGIYEVFKRVLQQRDESQALRVVALMEQGTVVDLNAGLALSAARISTLLKLPLADSVMLATARAFDAVFWTQDSDFADLEGVRYVEAR